jgi:flagellar biosynthetic protein FliR
MNAPGLLDLVGIQDWPAFVLVSARISGLFLAAPLWSMAGLPRSVRAAAAVVLSVILLPSIGPVRPLPDDMLASSVVLGGETLLGIAIGLTGAMILAGISLAGEVTSLQMGLSLGQALGSLPEGTTVGVGQLQGYFALTVYLSLGGHVTLYEGLAASFRAIPPGQAALGTLGGREVVELAATVFSGAIRVAAPMTVALLLANLALAILGKAVPQLNVMMISFPVTISIGLVMLGASLPFLASFLSGTIDGLPAQVGQAIQAFTPPPVVR